MLYARLPNVLRAALIALYFDSIEGKSQGGLRAADVLQSVMGRGRENEDGVPWGKREVPVMVA